MAALSLTAFLRYAISNVDVAAIYWLAFVVIMLTVLITQGLLVPAR